MMARKKNAPVKERDPNWGGYRDNAGRYPDYNDGKKFVFNGSERLHGKIIERYRKQWGLRSTAEAIREMIEEFGG